MKQKMRLRRLFGWGAVFFVCLFITAYPVPALRKLVYFVVPDIVLAAMPPAITITGPVDGQALNTTTVDVTGTTEPGVMVSVYMDSVFTGSIAADGSGGWTLAAGPLSEGLHTVFATAVDLSGSLGTSETVSFEVDITPPDISITSPVDGGYVNRPLIEGRTEPGAAVAVHVYGREILVTTDETGYWSCLDVLMTEGSYSVYAAATDRAGNSQSSGTNSFVLDTTRPVILPEISPPNDMTRVSLEVTAWVCLVEKNPLNPEYLDTAIILTEKGGSVSTSVYGTVYTAVYNDAYGDPYYKISFRPDLPLKPAAKYMAAVNPLLSDAAGNPVHPRTWSFTTVSPSATENPHGNYLDNVNTCVNCHTTHRGTAPRLVISRDPLYSEIDAYCNACHDGTAAPIPENWPKAVRHDYKVNIEGIRGISACTSCHNPHLPWTPVNPNFLQDYYYFDHNDPTNPYLPDSSEESMCELCHAYTILDDPRVSYVRYQYNKRHTATGSLEDYSLCLRCHDGSNATDIKTYYGSPSRHIITAGDESPLSGPIPCADCHNTHGSGNLRLLKEELGHNRTRTFQTAGDVWDAAAERIFCTGCHNNSTELYGIVAGFVYNIPGHEDTCTEPCSSCHGGSPAAAAHAPQ